VVLVPEVRNDDEAQRERKDGEPVRVEKLRDTGVADLARRINQGRTSRVMAMATTASLNAIIRSSPR